MVNLVTARYALAGAAGTSMGYWLSGVPVSGLSVTVFHLAWLALIIVHERSRP